MFYAAPTHVLAIFQFPTDQEMALQISTDPEVALIVAELRESSVLFEMRTVGLPNEPRRLHVLESSRSSGTKPRERTR